MNAGKFAVQEPQSKKPAEGLGTQPLAFIPQRKETLTMVKLNSDRSEHSEAYRQALDDFGITQLLSRIDNYRDGDFDAMRMALQKQEVESIAHLLIEQLIANLKGSVLANYLYLVRNRPMHRPWAIARMRARCKNQHHRQFCQPSRRRRSPESFAAVYSKCSVRDCILHC